MFINALFINASSKHVFSPFRICAKEVIFLLEQLRWERVCFHTFSPKPLWTHLLFTTSLGVRLYLFDSNLIRPKNSMSEAQQCLPTPWNLPVRKMFKFVIYFLKYLMMSKMCFNANKHSFLVLCCKIKAISTLKL